MKLKISVTAGVIRSSMKAPYRTWDGFRLSRFLYLSLIIVLGYFCSTLNTMPQDARGPYASFLKSITDLPTEKRTKPIK